jgi:hypothetical protein
MVPHFFILGQYSEIWVIIAKARREARYPFLVFHARDFLSSNYADFRE